MTANAWVVDSLEANCLLGNVWFMPRCIHIDYNSTNLSFLSFNGFYIPFDIQKWVNSVVCKVILVQKIILRSGETVFARTYYIAMSSRCSFLFSVTHLAVANILIDSKIPKTAYIVNLIQKTLVLAKNTCLGIIHKQVEMAHFVYNAANTLKAFAFAAAAGVISPLPAPIIPTIQNLFLNNRFPANLPLLANSFPNSTLPAVGTEFSFTLDIIKAFIAPFPEETAKQNPPILPLDPTSELPYSDAIYTFTNSLNISQALTGSGSTNNGDSG